MKTVLIFAYECYPYHRKTSTIGAQRPYHFAQNLAKLGWRTIVVCCDQEQRRSLSKANMSSTVDVLFDKYIESSSVEQCSIIPLPSLSYTNILDYVWSKSVHVGNGGEHIPKGFPFSLIRKAATIYNQLFKGDYSNTWVPVVTKFTKKLLEKYKVDIIIGEHGPDAGIILADKFSQSYSIPWVADFRDPVLWPFKGLLRKLYKPVMQNKLKSASATINVNPYWSSLDKDLFSKPSYTIVNGYDADLFNNVKSYVHSKFTISYFGSFNEQFQDIKPSLEAIAEFLKKQNKPEDVTLFYRGLQHDLFRKYCEAAGIPASNLDVDGFVSRELGIAYMKGSDVLLIYSIPQYKVTDVYEAKGFYPGKVFEYIGARKPILLYPSDYGILAELIIKEKIGMVCDKQNDALDFIMKKYALWKNGKSTFLSMGVDENPYSRYIQAVFLDKIISKVITNS